MRKSKFAKNKILRDTGGIKVVQDAKTVAKRAFALMYVCLMSEAIHTKDAETEKYILNNLKELEVLKEQLTKQEHEFIFGKNRSQEDVTKFNWHYERLAVLLWALGYKIALDWDKLANAGEMVNLIMSDIKAFFTKPRLRKAKEIINFEAEANEAYWICVDARINAKEISAYSSKPINSEAAQERLCAIRWICGGEKEEWDDVRENTYYPYKPSK
jgi:hypothetical protein